MKTRKILILLFVGFLLNSCTDDPSTIKYPVGHFPEIVENFDLVNSIYDDYNSNLQMLYDQYFLQFSSNRNSLGGDYDIVGRNVYLSWDQLNGGFSIEPGS